MSNTIEELVEKHYDVLNENDLYIWQYIYHHKEQVQKMSIQELSHMCNVSHTSILRFTKKIGLEGDSELKFYLKLGLEQGPSFDRNLIHNSVNELTNTLRNLEGKDLDDILKLIDEARHVFIYGTGEVQYNAALEFKREFAYRRKIMHVVEGKTEIDTVLHTANEEDVFIIISMSGENEVAVNLAKALRKMRISSIGIALDTNNLLKKYCKEFIGFTCHAFHTGYYNI
ncbi:MAG: MurR/RpiR family transcriptional regulator [Coprobacillaceae bacterium]